MRVTARWTRSPLSSCASASEPSETAALIAEVWIVTLDVFDIGSESDEATAGAETAGGSNESVFQGKFVGEVFDETSAEDDVEGGGGEGPTLTAILEEEVDFGNEETRGLGIEVQGMAPAAKHEATEFVVTAGEIEDGRVG